MIVDHIDQNCFLFKFQGRGDVDRVLEGRPWFFDGHVLLLEEVYMPSSATKINGFRDNSLLDAAIRPSNFRLEGECGYEVS